MVNDRATENFESEFHTYIFEIGIGDAFSEMNSELLIMHFSDFDSEMHFRNLNFLSLHFQIDDGA